MLNRRSAIRNLVAGTAASLASVSVWAQEDRSLITILVNAGTSVDASARLVAEQLQAALRRPVVVVPKLGAGGRLAIGELRRSLPDGRTLLFGPSSPFAVYPNIYQKLDYDPVKDFSFIGAIGSFDVGIAASPQSGIETIEQLIEWAKAKGKDAVYGVAPGTGSASHFAGIALSLAAGAPMTPVPYRASMSGVVDLVEGRIPILITGSSPMLEMHKAARLKIVAVTGAQRSPLLPTVPTLVERGMNVVIENFIGVYGPQKLPREVCDQIYAAMLPMLSKPEVQAALLAQGMVPAPMAGPQFAQTLNRERERYEKLARAVGYVKEDS